MAEEKRELTGEAIHKAFAVAGNKEESLLFLQDELTIQVVRRRAGDEFAPYMSAIADKIEHVRTVNAIHDTAWAGNPASYDDIQAQLKNYNLYLAKRLYDEIGSQVPKEKLHDITMIYDIGSSGFVRGYLRAGQPLDPENDDDQKIIAVMDEAFHSWLVSHDMLSREGIIYEAKTDEEMIEPVNQVEPQEFVALLEDKENSFEMSVAEVDSSLKIRVQRQGGPSPSLPEEPRALSSGQEGG